MPGLPSPGVINKETRFCRLGVGRGADLSPWNMTGLETWRTEGQSPLSGRCAKEEEGAEDAVKGKFQPVTCNEDTEGEYSYGSTLSLTSELNGVGV